MIHSLFVERQVSEYSIHRALRVWIMPGVPQAYLFVTAVNQTHKMWVGSRGLLFHSCSLLYNVLWITFLFTNSVSIKCILLIKLTCYNNNQRFYLPKDAITHMLRVCVWTSGHSLHTHLHPYRLLRPLQDTGSLISWQALNKAPTVLKTDKCDDLPLMAEENVTK